MKFNYTKENLNDTQRRQQRIFEIIPGTVSWTILLSLLFLTIAHPVAASIVSIAFILLWFMRLTYMTIFLVIAFIRLRQERKTDWMTRVKSLPADDDTPSLKDIYHVVILPVAKEPREVIAPAIEALSKQSFPTQKIFVFFALEERAPQNTKQAVADLIKKNQSAFADFICVVHPDNIPGEARVKGANASCAARYAANMLKTKNISYDNTIVSCFDADTVVNFQYFACLTYYFLTTPDRNRASYQPIPVYNNNIWHVPGFSRVMEIGSSFFQLIEATNPEKLVTFSSHSMSFKALVEVGYWPVDMISDDSAIFWKSYLHYEGRYRAVPMSITVSMDATAAENWQRTFQNVYKQRRRWAYGVENFPILLRGFLATPTIPLSAKIHHAFRMLEGHVSWASWGFLLTTLGWLPALLADQQFQNSVIYYNEPHIAATIFRLSTISMAISIFMSIVLLPKPNSNRAWFWRMIHALEWLAIPFVLVFLSALPALDAQTRLMFGRYMEFWVTDKSRK